MTFVVNVWEQNGRWHWDWTEEGIARRGGGGFDSDAEAFRALARYLNWEAELRDERRAVPA